MPRGITQSLPSAFALRGQDRALGCHRARLRVVARIAAGKGSGAIASGRISNGANPLTQRNAAATVAATATSLAGVAADNTGLRPASITEVPGRPTPIGVPTPIPNWRPQV